MPKPSPDPFEPSELPALAREVIRDAKFPMLASLDGDQPRLRPVSPVRVDGFTIYVANLRSYHKTGEIESNPKVELCYLSPGHDQLRITPSHILDRESGTVAAALSGVLEASNTPCRSTLHSRIPSRYCLG